jgi:hypothetical protein
MPTKGKRETSLIRLFQSAYENRAWAADLLEIPDERIDGGVDGFVERASDACRLAIEHTLIQPHIDDRKDFARFGAALLPIERDKSLAVPGRIIQVSVKSGTLKPGSSFSLVSEVLHEWLRQNVQTLPLGRTSHECSSKDASGNTISLLTQVYPNPTFPGSFMLRRFFEEDTLGIVVEKVLRDKLPKLANTPADQRVLLLEREQMSLDERRILREIDARRAEFVELQKVQIWFAETVFYAREGAVDFNQYENNKLVHSLQFYNGRLKSKSDGGFATIIERI